MRHIRLILTLTLSAAILAPAQAAPPASGNQGRRTFATKPLPRNNAVFAPQTVRNQQPPFSPPRSFGGTKPSVPAVKHGFPVAKPVVPTVKPGLPLVKPSAPTVKPSVVTVNPTAPSVVTRPLPPVVVKPSRPLIRPGVPAFNSGSPTLPAKPPAGAPKAHDRDFVLKDGRGPARGPAGRGPVGPGPIHLDPALDADHDGIIDALEPGNLPILDVGGQAGNGGNANPPVANNNNNNNGPTAWDWVAIGLSAAALADSLAHNHGGVYVNDGVIIDRPVVRADPAPQTVIETVVVPPSETVVVREVTPVEAETPTIIEEDIVTPSPLETVETAGTAAAESPTEPTSASATLPRLRVGVAFELPAKGLGEARGRVAVKVGVVILECPVAEWSDTGFRATVARATLEAATRADLIVALADGTVAASIPVELLPADGTVAGSTK
ncbi:MAG: hypothetical protein ACKO6E_10895 [Planctomycetota bacterium]